MPDDLPRIPRHRGPKNKPSDAAWLQQTLPAYRPLFTLRRALPILIVLGFACLILAALLFTSSLQAQEGVVDYTNCLTDGSSSVKLHELSKETSTCTYNITLDGEFNGDVFFYYSLEGFYQNMRKYFRSRHDDQLRGAVRSTASECDPVRFSNGSIPIVPCGAVANSMFNDTFKLHYRPMGGGDTIEVPFTTEDALPAALRRKYKNPIPCSSTADKCEGFNETAKPPNWQQHISKMGYGTQNGRGLENFDFIVWMETAALPKFRKIYRKLNRTGKFGDGLPSGTYTLEIKYAYPVEAYGGRKKFIIATQGMMGRKSNFQSIAFFVLSILILVACLSICAVEFMGATICSLLRRFQ